MASLVQKEPKKSKPSERVKQIFIEMLTRVSPGITNEEINECLYRNDNESLQGMLAAILTYLDEKERDNPINRLKF